MFEPKIDRNRTRSSSGTDGSSASSSTRALELEQRQLAIDVELRAVEVGRGLLGSVVDFRHEDPTISLASPM